MSSDNLVTLGVGELFVVERDCFDPAKISRAASLLDFEIEYANRPFFKVTGTIAEISHDTEAIQELILDPTGLEVASAPKAYRMTTPRTNHQRPVRQLFRDTRHHDSMQETVIYAIRGDVAVKLDPDTRDFPPVRTFDIHPGDRLTFRADQPHSFVPRDSTRARQSLSIPIIKNDR